MKPLVAAFDFDGTLTHGDTLIPFIRRTLGTRKFWYAVIKTAPWLVAYVLKLYPNGRAKERLFEACFAGMAAETFRRAAETFAEESRTRFLRPEALRALENLHRKGAKIFIVSASMEEWVAPFLAKYPDITYLTTRPELSADGKLTGRFTGLNCYGAEKVRRLTAALPDRERFTLYAFGDSRGDREMLSFADHARFRDFTTPE